jgi:hypothetical protein
LLLAVSGCAGGVTPGAPTAANQQVEAFCNDYVDLEAAASGSDGPPPETPEAAKAAAQELRTKIEPLIVKVEQTAPEAVKQDIATQAAAARQVFETGDFAAFDSPEFNTANTNLDKYMVANCGWQEVKVTATDHEYSGLPKTLQAGVVGFTIVNEGQDSHVLVVARFNDGVTQTVDQLIALPEQEAFQLVTPAGAAFANPGQSDTTFIRLTPGRYAAVCPIPEGTTEAKEGTGPPHAVLGMKAEITVT